jgi:hypothetical protein
VHVPRRREALDAATLASGARIKPGEPGEALREPLDASDVPGPPRRAVLNCWPMPSGLPIPIATRPNAASSPCGRRKLSSPYSAKAAATAFAATGSR